MLNVRLWAIPLSGLMLAALVGCANKKPDQKTAAVGYVDMVHQVLDLLDEGFTSRDADKAASAWVADRRPAARQRIQQGLARFNKIDLEFRLLTLKVVGEQLEARVRWDGVRDGAQAAGVFEVVIAQGPPPQIVSLGGDDPMTAVAGLPGTRAAPP